MIKIGYGISDYESMVVENRHYVDRTNYISILENITQSKFLFFLRPRRFGKAETVVARLFNSIKATSHKIYLLIDEYDHFTNELVSFDLEGFKKIYCS